MKRKVVAMLGVLILIVVTGCAGDSERDGQTIASAQSAQDEAATTTEEKATDGAATRTIVIDPGHSSVVSGEMEPLGPGSSELKAADSTGTQGVTTGMPEYELTLEVSEKLQTELEARGYTVILTRTTNDAPLSCVERADVANDHAADALVRIHANGSEDQTVQGAMTICISPDNPFHPSLYPQSRRLSEQIIEAMCAAAGCQNDGVWETDTMSGNNWSQVPATIIEMGYMTNPSEDQLMASEDYQNKLVQGIADGIDAYFAGLAT